MSEARDAEIASLRERLRKLIDQREDETRNGRKLWLVTPHSDLVVAARDAGEAERIAAQSRTEWSNDIREYSVREIGPGEALPGEWDEACIPWGDLYNSIGWYRRRLGHE